MKEENALQRRRFSILNRFAFEWVSGSVGALLALFVSLVLWPSDLSTYYLSSLPLINMFTKGRLHTMLYIDTTDSVNLRKISK